MDYHPKPIAPVIDFSSAQAQAVKVNMDAVIEPRKRSFSIDGHYLTGSPAGLVRQSMNYSAEGISQAIRMAENNGLISRISMTENPPAQMNSKSSFTPLYELKSRFQKVVGKFGQ